MGNGQICMKCKLHVNVNYMDFYGERPNNQRNEWKSGFERQNLFNLNTDNSKKLMFSC